jgi:hypothetical protein
MDRNTHLFNKDAFLVTVSGEEMAEIVREMGFVPELTKDGGGDPMIKLRIEGLRCQILFYGCKDGRANSLQFNASFADKAPMQKMNEWNRKKRFGKAFLDADNDICIQMDVDLDGGVRKEYLEEILKRWRSVFTGFIIFMGE